MKTYMIIALIMINGCTTDSEIKVQATSFENALNAVKNHLDNDAMISSYEIATDNEFESLELMALGGEGDIQLIVNQHDDSEINTENNELKEKISREVHADYINLLKTKDGLKIAKEMKAGALEIEVEKKYNDAVLTQNVCNELKELAALAIEPVESVEIIETLDNKIITSEIKPKNFDVQSIANQVVNRLNYFISAKNNHSLIDDADYDVNTPINMGLSELIGFSEKVSGNDTRNRITFESSDYKVTVYDNWSSLCRLLTKFKYNVETGVVGFRDYKTFSVGDYYLPSQNKAHIELCEHTTALDDNANQNIDFEMALSLHEINNENLCLVRRKGNLHLAIKHNGRGYIPQINNSIYIGHTTKLFYPIDSAMTVEEFISEQGNEIFLLPYTPQDCLEKAHRERLARINEYLDKRAARKLARENNKESYNDFKFDNPKYFEDIIIFNQSRINTLTSELNALNEQHERLSKRKVDKTFRKRLEKINEVSTALKYCNDAIKKAITDKAFYCDCVIEVTNHAVTNHVEAIEIKIPTIELKKGKERKAMKTETIEQRNFRSGQEFDYSDILNAPRYGLVSLPKTENIEVIEPVESNEINNELNDLKESVFIIDSAKLIQTNDLTVLSNANYLCIAFYSKKWSSGVGSGISHQYQSWDKPVTAKVIKTTAKTIIVEYKTEKRTLKISELGISYAFAALESRDSMNGFILGDNYYNHLIENMSSNRTYLMRKINELTEQLNQTKPIDATTKLNDTNVQKMHIAKPRYRFDHKINQWIEVKPAKTIEDIKINTNLTTKKKNRNKKPHILSERNLYLLDKYNAGRSLYEIFQDLKQFYMHQHEAAELVFQDFIKSQKYSGNQELMNEFNRTAFIDFTNSNIKPTIEDIMNKTTDCIKVKRTDLPVNESGFKFKPIQEKQSVKSTHIN